MKEVGLEPRVKERVPVNVRPGVVCESVGIKVSAWEYTPKFQSAYPVASGR